MGVKWAYSGHKYSVNAVSVSHDGALVASASDDWTVAIVDGATGDELRKFTAHNNTVSAVVFAPDASGRVASGGWGKYAVMVWNNETLEVLHELKGHSNIINALAWSKDARLIASAAADDKVIVWDADLGVAVHTLSGHTGNVNWVAFANDSQTVISGSDDATAIVSNARTGKQLAVLKCKDPVVCVALDLANKRAFTLDMDNAVQVWDTTSWQSVRQFKTKHAHFMLWRGALSPDGKHLATVDCPDETTASLCLTDVDSGAAPVVLSSNQPGLLAVAFFPDGKHIVAAGKDKTVSVWPVPS